MAVKRSGSRGVGLAVGAPSTHAPWGTAALLGSALSYGTYLLVDGGQLRWPPTQFLANAFTVAGCLALVGPVLLRRKAPGEDGAGDLIWMVGGLLIWVFDAAAVARGEARSLAWATPVGSQSMGLIVLAVALAAWRCRIGGGNWSWTNVTGWVLGIFWVTSATLTMVPARALGLAFR